jgi:hypothetical protein
MDANQNPPSERDWTIEEQEEFFASQDAVTFTFNGCDVPKQPPIEWSTSAWNGPLIELDPNDPFGDMERLFPGSTASNAPMSSPDNPPITLSSLVKMNEEFQKAFPIPIAYRNGADMSRATFDELGKKIKLVKPQGEAWLGVNVDNFIGVDIHFVESVPFGAVEECRCAMRKDYLDALEFKENRDALPME